MITEQKTDPFEPPCVLYDFPFSDYLALPAASSHALGTLLAKSPLHARSAQNKPSEAKSLGTLTHAMLLTPDTWRDEVLVKPSVNRATNAGKAELVEWMLSIVGDPGHEAVEPYVSAKMADGKRFDAMLEALEPLLAATGKDVVNADKVPIAERMVESVLSKDVGRVIFESGTPELTMIAIEPISGVLCKIRPDWLPHGHEVIVDLKTAASASFEDFSRAAARYGYAIQAALYREIYHLIMLQKRPPFLHVVVENEPPYDCAIYEMDQEALESGEKKVRRALDIWAQCEESGYWPGIGYDYTEREFRIESLSLPKWAL
jgi:hypothetical protein